MNAMKKEISTLLVCCTILLLLAGCNPKMQEIHWDLTGTWISEDGEIGDTVSFSLAGKLVTDGAQIGDPKIVDLAIQFPEDFRYRLSKTQQYAVYAFRESGDSASLWFSCNGTAYDPAGNSPVPMTFALSPERGFVVMRWDINEGPYLVASADPQTDPKDILDWYQEKCHSKVLQGIRWNLTGTWITEDGEIGDTVSFSIKGRFFTNGNQVDYLQMVDFRIQWPEDFPYGSAEADSYGVYALYEEDGTNSLWFMCCGEAYTASENTSVGVTFALSPDREFVVMHWADNEDRYLVASTDPEADPEEIAAWYSSLPIKKESALSLQMNGTQIARGGKVLKEGPLEIAATITEKPLGTDTLRFSALNLAGTDFAQLTELDMSLLWKFEDDGFTRLHAVCPADNSIGDVVIYLDNDRQWCVVILESRQRNVYFVGSAAEEYDPVEILAKCRITLE